MTAGRPPDRRLAAQVRSFVEDHYGAVTSVLMQPSAGHSGRTLELVVARRRRRVGHVALRLGPVGVPQRGTADLVRQATLIGAAGRHGVPEPAVVASGSGPPWFDVGFHATEWIDGEVVEDWDPAAVEGPAAVRAARLAAAVDVLARLHKVPVPATGLDLDEARGPEHEVTHWRSLAARLSARPARDDVAGCAEALLACTPRPSAPGLLHGDYRLGNLVCAGSAVRGVLDWEVAGLGPVLLDLAWLLFFLDAAAWYGEGASLDDAERGRLVDRYRLASGADLADLPWYDALARFRYAVIILFNHHLHATGRRTDPLWDRMVRCVPTLLAGSRRAVEGLGTGGRR